MIPTLRVGDLILVNKFHYGLRMPVFNTKLVANNEPKRGDVMVFRYPPQPSLDYIKRVIGVPGDEVAYLDKRLTINGQPVPTSRSPTSLTATPCATPSSSPKRWMPSSSTPSTTTTVRGLCRAPAISRSRTTRNDTVEGIGCKGHRVTIS